MYLIVDSLNLEPESRVVCETCEVPRSLSSSARVLTAIVTNLSERWAAFSALMILASRKSAKARDLAKRPPGGSGGPNMGTDLERDTATLEEERGGKCHLIICSKFSDNRILQNFILRLTSKASLMIARA